MIIIILLILFQLSLNDLTTGVSMKNFIIKFCLAQIFLTPLVAEIKQSTMSSSVKPSAEIKSHEHYEPSKNVETKKSVLPPPIIQPPALQAAQSQYFHPGILVFQFGKWEGSDHLYNLTSNIGVYVTFLKPAEVSIEVTDDQIKKQIEEIFKKVRINPVTMVTAGKPPLPAFELEILLYPIHKGYVACCTGSLFESVNIDRFKMDEEMAFQAITWQKAKLIVGPISKFDTQLNDAIEEIAEAFADRFEAFERLKKT
jgi:hypothetical protein